MKALVLILISFCMSAVVRAATPPPPCTESVRCGEETYSCNAYTAGPTPSQQDSSLFTWSTGTCAKTDKWVSCEQKISKGPVYGPVVRSSDVTTYACCNSEGAVFFTSDASLATSSCRSQ